MLRSWYYSLLMLVTYVSLFLFWKLAPSRLGFVVGGLAAAIGLTAGMLWARRRKYFVDRIDICMHAYIIFDLFMEGIMYEVWQVLVRRFQDLQATSGIVSQFHDNNSYVFCTLTLAALVGGYRAFALRRRKGPVQGDSAPSESTELKDLTEPASA